LKAPQYTPLSTIEFPVPRSAYVDLLNLNLDNDDLPMARALRAGPRRLQQ
jgi:hypothetical protein